MKCQIVRNGGYTFLILCFITAASSFLREKTTTIQEFCSGNSFIRNIEPGEPFKLVFRSEEQAPPATKKWYISKRKCRQEYKTSDPSAHFYVAISNMNIPSCDDNCRCNYFEIEESGYKKRFCGNKDKDYFSSNSDKLSIEFHHGSIMRFDVSFMFTVERNVYIITGTPKDSLDSGNFIETPYFPIPYSPNYRAEYILMCDDPVGHVVLLFLDFQISLHSFIEVVGNNGTHPTRFYGDVFRPPVIVSQANQLSIKFQSNDQPGMPGFRALSSFVKSADTLVVPYTDCAESKNGRGGFIKIKTHERFGLYDCVWHIVSFTPFSKLNLSIFTHMRNISHKSALEFRCGSNSKSEICREINCENQHCYDLDIETVIPAAVHLYIRFKGYLDVYSIFNMSYSTYHMGNCSDKEFKCKNGRCLLLNLKCDGIPHCPDGSDEEFCTAFNMFEDEKPSIQSTERKILHSEDTYTYLVYFGCFGLLSVVLGILIFTYKKYCKKSITESNQTSGELTDVQPTLYPADPSDFLYPVDNSDNPPSYDDFVKTSNFYPPLLYTRAPQAFNRTPCSQCTTSFCSGARMRHYSADSFSPRNSDTSSGDIFLNIGRDITPEQHLNHNAYNVKIIHNNLSFKSSKNTVKRSYSLDSKLNNLVNHDSCHLLLSIVHPSNTASNHLPRVQWYTLPPNFKYDFKNCDNKSNVNEPTWLNLDSNVNLCKDRRLTWSFVPRNSVHSELVTVVKTRCSSEPCREISIQCSLY